MSRPYMRHSIDQLEAMPPCAALVAELEHRTTPRARKLLARLKSETAPVASMPIAAAQETRQQASRPVASMKGRAKAVASVRASNGHPGALPESWDSCTAEQLAWWRERYAWHSTLFVSTWPKRSPAEFHDAAMRADKWAKRNARKAKAPIVVNGDDGLAYLRDNLWCICPAADWQKLATHRRKRPEHWAKLTSAGPQRVLDPDPPARGFQLAYERWLEHFEAKRQGHIVKLAAQPEQLPMAA